MAEEEGSAFELGTDGPQVILVGVDDSVTPPAADMRRRAQEYASAIGVALTFITARGDPLTELKRVAAEVRADAVIVGASTKAGHRWIGSLAVRLVKAGRWPVTVVP